MSCNGVQGPYATYNERTVHLTTGALGSDVEVYHWSNSTEGYESIQFVADLLFDFVVPNNYQPGANSVNIYSVVPSTSTPLLTCTAQMLEACGYGTGVAHLSGEYTFMAMAPDLTRSIRSKCLGRSLLTPPTTFPMRSPNLARMERWSTELSMGIPAIRSRSTGST